jgi:membrane-associated phospholipid phosphatase
MIQASIGKKRVISLVVLVLGGVTILVTNSLIGRFFPNRPIADDLFFRILPYMPEFSILADFVVTAGMVVAIFYSLKRPNGAWELCLAVGLMAIMRGLLNVVTPLGDPSGDLEVYGFLERQPLLGMFPSGHVAALFLELSLLKSWKIDHKVIFVWYIFILIEILALLLTRGHYSIDIAAGAVLGWFVARQSQQFFASTSQN